MTREGHHHSRRQPEDVLARLVDTQAKDGRRHGRYDVYQTVARTSLETQLQCTLCNNRVPARMQELYKLLVIILCFIVIFQYIKLK